MAFASLRDADMLAWRQASMFARAIEVVRDNTLAGILRFEEWGMTCDATCADGMWTFRRHGFLWNRLSITRSGSDEAAAEYTSRFLGGHLRISSGAEFLWKMKGMMGSSSAFETPSGFPVVGFSPKLFAFQDRGSITVQREYRMDPDVPFLVMLGVFLRAQSRRRRHA